MINPANVLSDDIRARIVCYILNSVDAEGAWGRSDYEEWGPVTSALTIELLLLCGTGLDQTWYVSAPGATHFGSLRTSIKFLDGCISKSGACGEDAWDASQIARVIAKHGLEHTIKNAKQLYRFVDAFIAEGHHKERTKTWDGPGIIASLIQYANARKNYDVANRLLSELLLLQKSDGSFSGSIGRDGTPITSPVWHTALALRAMLENGLTEDHESVRGAIDWFETNQNATGSWQAFQRFEVYFTAHAVVTLSKLSTKPPCLQKAVAWLKTQVSPVGKAADAAGTLMSAWAFCSMWGFDFGSTLAGVDYHNAQHYRALYQAEMLTVTEYQNSIARLTSENDKLISELASWKARFGDAVFGINQSQIFWYSIIITVIVAVIGAIAGAVLPAMLTPAPPPPAQIQLAPQPNIYRPPMNPPSPQLPGAVQPAQAPSGAPMQDR